MTEKEAPSGELDFSDGELSEMGVELAGREGAQPTARKSRSMLRVPVDEVPRPQGQAAGSTEPSLPAMPEQPPDAADEVVDHAFRNGGQAEGDVPATLHLAAAPAKDELEIFSAQLLAERDRERGVIELQMEDADTDPKALQQLRASEGAMPQQTIDDGPTRQVRATPPQGSPRLSPALAALARAVTVPPAENRWLPAAKTKAEPDSDAVWSSAPPPEGVQSAVVLVDDAIATAVESGPVVAHDAGETDDMELDDGELEEVESQPPLEAQPQPPPRERLRTLTPVVPPPPLPNGDAAHPVANGQAPATAGASAHQAASSQPHLPPSPPAMPASVSAPHAVPPLPPTTTGQHHVVPPPSPVTQSGQHPVVPHPPSAVPPVPPPGAHHAPIPSGQHQVPPGAPPVPPVQPMAPSSSQPIAVNGEAAPPPAPASEAALRPRRKRRAKQWFEEIFDDDYLRTLPFLTPRQTEREARFVSDSLQIPAGGNLLDLACGYGRHAMELAANGYKVTGLDLSLPLLIRAADAARRVRVNVNFIHGDMREMTFENEFDGAYCMFTSFGYFDDDTNRKVAANLARAIKPGGKLLLDVVNRDYLVRDLPTRVWWQGDGCVVLEEVDFNYFSSRLQVQRSIIFEDGRQVEQEISIRAYSLHEIGKVLHHSGFRVTEVSGGLSLRGKFFGADSRQLIVVAEKKSAP